MRSLNASGVDVWLARPQIACEPATYARLLGLLPDEEKARIVSFRSEASRCERLVARAQLRWALSRYADVAPRAWHLAIGEHGRPRLDRKEHEIDLRFSVSHTRGLVACAVSLGREVGIDVEHLRARISPVELADRFFAPPEAEDVRTRPPAERTERFLRYWTLKESWLKARGVGLAASLRTRAFRLADVEDGPHVDREGHEGGDKNCLALEDGESDGWRFWQWRPTIEHVLALAVAVEPAADERIDVDVVEFERLA